MPTIFDTSRVQKLAKTLEEDIRSRGLTTGDRYFTASEAAEAYDVSISTAHRALKILADSHMLMRRRNHGTFVGSPEGKRYIVDTIHYIEPAATDSRADDYSCWVKALREHFPNVSVQFNCVPAENAVEYTSELIRTAKLTGNLLGIVVNSYPDVYPLLSKSGVPTVVSGSLRHDDPLPASLDIDNHESGRLLTRYLAERGHRRIFVFAHDNDRPGTHDLLDGVAEGITEAGLPANALMVRFFSNNFDAFGAAVKAELECGLQSESRPTAAITYGINRARLVTQAATELGLSKPRDFEVVFCGEPASGDDAGMYTRAVGKMSDSQRVSTVAEMLKQLSDGRGFERKRVVIPVELLEAEPRK
ncbi:MAG: substrate-binding domain-containing protein [Pirellulales bacterium]|nr:substrate-binding domain-containing protein [Pirellulales bacterium]